MDIELARTFLEVVRTGSLIAAAEQLHVTQTTVTARLQNLESQLGCRLFIRNRSGAKLTDNGERFATHAHNLVQTWEMARRELPLPVQVDRMLRLGGETSLWDPLLLAWLQQLRTYKPNVAVRAEVGGRNSLYRKLEQGTIDAALVHQPEYRPEMQVEQLLEEKLIMVRGKQTDTPYIYVDWGEHFHRQHDAALPERIRPVISLDLGPLALKYLLLSGGSGYFRTRVVQPFLDRGLLERVPAAPEFSHPVHLVYSRNRKTDLLEESFIALHDAKTRLDDWSQLPGWP